MKIPGEEAFWPRKHALDNPLIFTRLSVQGEAKIKGNWLI